MESEQVALRLLAGMGRKWAVPQLAPPEGGSPLCGLGFLAQPLIVLGWGPQWEESGWDVVQNRGSDAGVHTWSGFDRVFTSRM